MTFRKMKTRPGTWREDSEKCNGPAIGIPVTTEIVRTTNHREQHLRRISLIMQRRKAKRLATSNAAHRCEKRRNANLTLIQLPAKKGRHADNESMRKRSKANKNYTNANPAEKRRHTNGDAMRKNNGIRI